MTPVRRVALRVSGVAVVAVLVPVGALLGAAPSYAGSAEDAFAAMAAASGTEVAAPRAGQAREENAGLAELAASAEQAAAELAENAWQLPMAPGDYRITATFGQCSGLWAHCHTGLDLAAPEGTELRSIANGTVTGTGWAGAYGNRTVVTLEDGTEVWYCHQSRFGVRAGQPVVGGQVIGYVGSTGNTTGPHLHLEIRPGGGDAVDPQRALTVRGVTP